MRIITANLVVYALPSPRLIVDYVDTLTDSSGASGFDQRGIQVHSATRRWLRTRLLLPPLPRELARSEGGFLWNK